MNSVTLEHINVSVSDPDASAQILCDLFAWKIRWSGPAMDNGYTVHVGTDQQYIAFYTCGNLVNNGNSGNNALNLNHIAVTVDDIEQVEKDVQSAGLTPCNHADYEPGRRFYFLMQDELEIEVVSYAEDV